MTERENTMGREQQRLDFLSEAGLADAVRIPLAGDASTRRYERLTTADGTSLILMDQPPSEESAVAPADADIEARKALGYNAEARLAGGSVAAFVAIAGWLRERGLSTPVIGARDTAAGLAVLEDLGDDVFAAHATGLETLYGAAVDALAGLHAATPPAVIQADGEVWPLHRYDALAYRAGLDPFLDWWPQFAGLAAPSDDARAEWSELWAPVIALGEAGAPVFVHRDYHAENLLWLPRRDGLARVGMLDFQDAVAGHPAWDLLHLLQDARRDVSPELEAAMLDRYLAARPDLDREAFLHEYRALAALNAARILGRVFARQEVLFRRDRYTAFMPRTWRHLERNLAGEGPAGQGLAGLRQWFDRHIPAEARAAINRAEPA
ncbi:N-acetylmuramate/N-acetylglucosamine kinase AmgK [Brevundimonas sp.]|uniref:N-acetylmuramate/N-acetylglucosamine kinase AmgK n=1 Tax=Brevundimonas sp. TaxID=1871086 RepID=UPI003BA878A4